MTETFQLSNSRGEIVGINNYDLLSYTPTGLGLDLSNSYNQYENYFRLSKTTVNQGKFQINILFGDIESQVYQTFTDFATFLSYQPMTMIYTTDIGVWYRDARLASLTKTEIGGTTVFQTNRLNESFSLDFINPWYNNKEGVYRAYDSDSNLSIFGKGFFNEIGTANHNYILNSSGENSSDTSMPSIVGGLYGPTNSDISYKSNGIILTYNGTGDTEWGYDLAEKWTNLSDTVLNFDDTYTISVDVMGTVPAVFFNITNMISTPVKINASDWTRITYTFKFPNLSGDNMSQLYMLLRAGNGTDTNPTGFTAGQYFMFRHFKLEVGSTATDWITAPEDGQTDMNMLYTYGYMGVAYDDDANQPFADVAEADKTHLDN